MQDDCLLPHLTVREAMTVSANLKLGKDMPPAAKKIVIDEILEMLGLSDSGETRTINLSGGQKKRLSIALELVNNPPVMFFDEPTSGLDSSACFQCISLLKSLARGGRTIICTIHQPSARLFEMFDFLYTLAEGQCIYQGPVRELVPFLSTLGLHCPSYHNPADYVMTVREAMTVSANLKLGKNMPPAAKKIVIDEILEMLGLSDSGETRTINLSGGQKKRLSIALELVNNPPVMFFDEPTSGLDSSACFQCISLLKSLARGGRTIICTIHQPSARLFEMFDFLYTLAEGQCIYQGPVRELVPFLSTLGLHCPSYHNPADYVPQNCHYNNQTKNNIKKEALEVQPITNTNNLAPVTCTTSLLDSNESFNKKPLKAGFPTSGWKQFWILLKRTFKSILRDPTLTHLRLFSHTVVGLLIGFLYYDIGTDAAKVMSNAGCIFFTVMFTMFTAMMPTILTLYFMTSQPLQMDRLLMFTTVNILTALVAQSLGLLIGAAMKIETGVYLGPVTTIPIVLFSGFFVNFNAIPDYLQWLTYLSYIRYGFEGAMLAVYGYDREKLKCSEAYCHFRTPSLFLKEMSMDKANFWIDVGALSAFFIFIRVISYLVLRFKLKMLQ
ncbi:unnamed protein product [Leptidea sinapis]|uniref:ABC transporter domain-containing protein n=1 Tax=Leptidea sinapis TaxID=189913 RepID=A0A5E4R4S4_9NEOP|nr:unnamed protein product [Leptidea sinapis]